MSRRRRGLEDPPRDPESDIRWLLSELCSELGFCNIQDQADAIVQSVPRNAAVFADRVFLAEGLDPAWDRDIWRQVRDKIQRRVGQLLPDGPDPPNLSPPVPRD